MALGQIGLPRGCLTWQGCIRCPSRAPLTVIPARPSMPHSTLDQVRSFFTLCWRQSPVLYDELGFLRDVHGPLRARILRHVGSQLRPLLPILQARLPIRGINNPVLWPSALHTSN